MKKILYIDMDNVLVDFQSAFTKVSIEILSKYKGREDQIDGIFGLMDPLPNAIESFNELADLFDTYILSTSPWSNESAWIDKIRWVKKYLGEKAKKRLILSHHKNLNLGDFLIDDRTRNGADQFKGEHIHFGQPKFPNWNAVMIYLKDKV
jgi:5'(3')-deoxyribonucleotidase